LSSSEGGKPRIEKNNTQNLDHQDTPVD